MTRRIIRPLVRVRFEWVGTDRDVPDLVTEAREADELATKIWRYVRRRLRSGHMEVQINLDTGVGTITVRQGQPAGEFTVSRVASMKPGGESRGYLAA